ncbi:MAG: hypothetical protein BGO67_08325 [Alphaproteobacteria bacterium 41-28]|nr:MAG: hypothetical protein BGO67_08325 [Alphaproteobacteria bacterium 41-28]
MFYLSKKINWHLLSSIGTDLKISGLLRLFQSLAKHAPVKTGNGLVVPRFREDKLCEELCSEAIQKMRQFNLSI